MKKIIVFIVLTIFIINLTGCAFLNLQTEDDFKKLPQEHQAVLNKRISKVDSFIRWQHLIAIGTFFIPIIWLPEYPSFNKSDVYKWASIFLGIYLFYPRNLTHFSAISDSEYIEIKEKLPILNFEQDEIFRKYANKIMYAHSADAEIFTCEQILYACYHAGIFPIGTMNMVGILTVPSLFTLTNYLLFNME